MRPRYQTYTITMAHQIAQYVLPVNKRIFDFYKSNPHISFETMNVILLNFIEQVSTDMSKLMTNTLIGEILSHVKDLRGQQQSFLTQLQTWQEGFSGKLHEHNKSLLDTTKLVVDMATKDNTDKIMQLMEKQADVFIQKVAVDMPQVHQTAMQLTLTQFQQQFLTEVRHSLQQHNPKEHLEQRLSQLQQLLHGALLTVRDEQKVYLQEHTAFRQEHTAFRQEHTAFRQANDRLTQDIGEFITKFKGNVQYKGQCSEQLLQNVLNRLFPAADIINTSGFRASGDLRLKRDGKPDILFENKLYENNVPAEEVKKFVRDVGEQKCHGILLSQNSGVVGKPNFHLDVHDGKVLLYLHNVDYSTDKMKTAVDSIDHLATKLATVAQEEEAHGVEIPKEALTRINEQYQHFLQQRDMLSNTAKEIQKKLLLQIDGLTLPELNDILRLHLTSAHQQTFPCEVCQELFPTKRSLAAHKKKHGTGTGTVSAAFLHIPTTSAPAADTSV